MIFITSLVQVGSMVNMFSHLWPCGGGGTTNEGGGRAPRDGAGEGVGAIGSGFNAG